jgi:mono/diheme cytochrome c family protein
MLNGIDAKYVHEREALAPTQQNVEAGRTIFGQSCAACHGFDGRGDGPSAQGLNPPPANLAAAIRMPMTTDAYFDWTISEGGTPVGSAMPPFKSVIAGDDLSKLILYLRTLQERPPVAR